MSDNNRLLDHADEADGIQEYDNPLPDWWLGLFFVTIAWGAVYLVDWHFWSKRSQQGYYDAEVAEAKIRWPTPTAAVAADLGPEALKAGEAVFQANCVACHGADLHGGIGPNLVDDTWIHGGTLLDIQHTIDAGVPDKGMITWGPILGPEKVAQVAAYVYSRGPKAGG